MDHTDRDFLVQKWLRVALSTENTVYISHFSLMVL